MRGMYLGDQDGQNARFWQFVNGSDVKLTLQPGQTLGWGRTWGHEEGWSSEFYLWRHDGDGVRVRTGTDGYDCDGRLSTETEGFCPLGSLDAHRFAGMPEGIRGFPQWDREKSSQRDYEAEKAGY